MSLRPTTRALLAAALILPTLACSIDGDPVAHGELCSVTASLASADPTGCPTEIILGRGTPLGRNAIDFELINEGPFSQVEVLATPPANATTDADAGDLSPDADALDLSTDAADLADLDTTSADADALSAQRSYLMSSGDRVRDRFLPSELGRQDQVRLSVRCDAADCAVRLRYVLSVEPIECTASEDCSSGWQCDAVRGQCAECLSDSSCASGQTCELGRCTPQALGCAAPSTPPGAPWPLGALGLLVVALLLVALRWAPARLRRLLACAVFGCLLGALGGPSSEALARGPEARLTIETGPRFFTGELGKYTRTGLGLSVGQELRGRYIGGALDLSASYFVTTQEPPPLSRSLLVYSARFGPRAYLPINDAIELVGGVQYERLGLASNSLVQITGERIGYHAVATGLGAQWRTPQVEARLWGGWHVPFGLPGTIISLNISIVLVGSSKPLAGTPR